MGKISLKYVIITIVIIGSFFSFLFYFKYKGTNKEAEKSELAENCIYFEKQNIKLYYSAKTWGITGNHDRIVLSSFPLNDGQMYIKDQCYVFYTSELYYKIQGKDSLLIYVDASAISDVPNNFSSKIKIGLIEIKNYDEGRDYEANYKRYGLTKIITTTSDNSF